MLKIGHLVTRPGKTPTDPEITLQVPEELETAPGIVQRPAEVDFYSREYPLELANVETTADRDWEWPYHSEELNEFHKEHDRLNRPLVAACRATTGLEPTGTPVPGKDVSQLIKNKARELGIGEVGITRLDKRYVYKFIRDYVQFQHAVCIAFEQDYEGTQGAPGMSAERPHFDTYREMTPPILALGDYIRSLGYHAQVHHPDDNVVATVAMLMQAGMGQLGANGQLLSPHFGSRARHTVITTDALVTYDEPVDYGMHAFCDICQVCVNRCPGRALMRDKVWWRGVQKHKLIYRRCRPVIARYEGCAVCMKVCPIQRYGMKNVLDHYVATGSVLGKGTHALEGYTMKGKGYFGPGELPRFNSDFFDMPHGRSEDVAFEDLKDRIKGGELPDGAEGDQALQEFRERIEKYVMMPLNFQGDPHEEYEQQKQVQE